MAPLVSILIPAFNAQNWIGDTLRSAVAQTWPRKEIIVVNDGSTDDTEKIARTFESSGVKVVTQEGAGAAAARNTALSLSQGDYIQWLDADDLLGADKISRQMEVAERSGSKQTLLSGSFGRFMYRTSQADFARTALWCDLSPAEFLIRKLGQKIHMQTAVWLVSRELTEAAGKWNTAMVFDDDGEYFCRVLLATENIRFVEEARVYYRTIGTGRVSYVGRSNKKLDAVWASMQLHMNYLRSLENSERVRASCLKYLQHYVFVFHPIRPDILEQMQKAARSLGGELTPPKLSWKYRWIRAAFGWEWTHHAQLVLPRVKWSMLENWDNLMFHLERRMPESRAVV